MPLIHSELGIILISAIMTVIHLWRQQPRHSEVTSTIVTFSGKWSFSTHPTSIYYKQLYCFHAILFWLRGVRFPTVMQPYCFLEDWDSVHIFVYSYLPLSPDWERTDSAMKQWCNSYHTSKVNGEIWLHHKDEATLFWLLPACKNLSLN